MQRATPQCPAHPGRSTSSFARNVFSMALCSRKRREMRKRTSSPRYKFSVYIARETRISDLAVERLTKICEENIPGEYQIEVIDIAKRPDLARNQDIIATPAVFRTLPAPLRKSIGDLSHKDRAILGLDLLPAAKSRGKATRRRRSTLPQAAD